MAVAVLDVGYLSAYLGLPQQTFDTLLDTPTIDLVQSVLAAVSAKAHEHDELAADKLTLDIELENAVRSSETRIEGLRASLNSAQRTTEEVRKGLKNEEDARSALETELQTLKSATSSSTSDSESLRARILSLESANRDAVAVLEAKTTANDSLAEELQKQHQKGLQLSQQITSLQQAVQNATSVVSSAKFREQALQQEVELAKRNNDWFEAELKTKSSEALKYRREKGARISELQRLNEEANANLEALKKTEQALRSRIVEVQAKAEDSLAKVQQLQEAAARSEDGFRQELESAHRLADLQAQQTDTHRNRLKEVEAALEKMKEDVADEIGRCRQETEAERQDRERAEHRISELEAEIDRLEALLTAPRHGSVPGTPRQGVNGASLGRAGSPAQIGTPGSVRSRSTITATQALDELYKVKGQLATEKRRGDRLAAEIEEIMQGLEAKQPEIEELQAEHTRLQQEVVEMSKFVDQTGKERDRAKRDARKAESELATAHAEGNILRQQLRDLSAQVKMLLCEAEAREKGLDPLDPAERLQLERLARGEVEQEELDDMTDTDRLISQRLTVFRNVKELQEKNQELLKITRQLGAQMESEEAIAAKHQAALDHEAVQRLQGQIENYKSELQSIITRSESYIKERDMFRRMLQHRGQLPPQSDLASVFGQSVDGSQNGVVQTVEQGVSGRDGVSYVTLLRELQAHFDQYREEQTIDRRTMKEQTEKLSIEKGTLQAEVAKVTSQYVHATERFDLLQANYTMLQTENGELQKRSRILSESAAKQDFRTQQVAEDLIEAKGIVESMRNENANLKAEKKLWKDIQDRLSHDNENLMNERSRLNGLIANQQTLQNERELSDSETRRRLQAQVETLEIELNAAKRKLADEAEENKKAQLRKEYDSQQNQKRIDDLAATLSQVREELVAVKTTRDHLQSRVDELTIELKSAEERVELLQPRPTPRPGLNTVSSGENGDGANGNSLDREQELAIEISELKRDLDLSKSELEAAKNQMEQYKSISQSSEEELQSLNATHDQYREEMDRVIGERDSKIRDQQQRIEEVTAELTNTNDELTALRSKQNDISKKLGDEKTELELEISRLKDEDERHSTAAQFHQQDLRAQAAIATKAQQDYENELVKHAEAAKLLQNLRTEHNLLKTESASLRADAESAKVALSQSEISWEESREQYQLEIRELRSRRDDVNSQNKLLHQQLEDLSSQIASIQQRRSTFVDASEPSLPAVGNFDRSADGLRELNTFLRREKEILEVQYDLKVQEAKRVQQQLEYAQSQLDESRLKLDQERRLHADGGRNAAQHKDLMEKLTELNLFRESSITLRNEARQAQIQLADKTKQVDNLLEQIQPLETRIRELEQGSETLSGELQLLQVDRDRWQKRTQDIISKYDRIDPAEMESLQETLESLRAERDSLLEEQQPLQDKIQALEAEKAAWQQSRLKLIEQAKEKNRLNSNIIKDRTTERDAAIQERDALQQKIIELQQQLDVAIQEKISAERQFTSLRQEIENSNSERDQNATANTHARSTEEASDPASATHPSEATNQQLAALRKELDEALQEKQGTLVQLEALRQELEKVTAEKDAAISDAANARSMQSSQPLNDNPNNKGEDGQPLENLPEGMTDRERTALEERISKAEAKAKEQEEKANKLEADMEATLKLRSDRMKTTLNKLLNESKESQKAELRDSFEADYRLKLEQERKIWAAESKFPDASTSSATDTGPSAKLSDAAPLTPNPPSQKPLATSTTATPDGTILSDAQVRELLSSNPTIKKILANNLKTKLEAETQKVKEEHERLMSGKLAEAQQKAESAKAQAVTLETKKSSLRINMFENKTKLQAAKLDIVQAAAKDSPQKPVVEVWDIVQAFKLAPTPSANTSEPLGTTNGAASSVQKISELKAGSPKSDIPPPPQTPLVTGPPSDVEIPTSSQSNKNSAALPASNIGMRSSGIPMARGGIGSSRGRGAPTQMYQAARGGGQSGRGRGMGPQRGNLNAGAPVYNPAGQAGTKRPREEGNVVGGQQGSGGKRPRGGGPNTQ